MRIIVWSDLHAGAHRFGARTTEQGYNTRLLDCVGAIEAINQAAIDHEVSFRLFCGDMFHTRGKLGAPSVFNPVVNAIANIHDGHTHNFIDIMIPGNHDDEARSDGEHAISTLNMIQDVNVLNGHGLSLLSANYHGEHIYLGWVCHHPDVSVMKARISEVATRLKNIKSISAISILLIHHGVDGTLPEIPDCGLTIGDLPTDSFDYIFVGDYHLHKELVPGKVWSVGTPLQHNFGDAGKRCGYLLLDTDAGICHQHELEAPPRFVVVIDTKKRMEIVGGPARPGDFVSIKCDDHAKLEHLKELYAKPVAAGGYGAGAVEGEFVTTDDGLIAAKIGDALRLATDPRTMFETWLAASTTLSPDDIVELRAINDEVLSESGIL